jgi:protein-disulfide isomerase
MVDMPKIRVPKVKVPEVDIPNIKKPSNLIDRFVPILLLATIVLAFIVGMLWERVNNLEKGGGAATTGTTQANQQQAAQGPNVTLAQIKDLFKKDVVKFGDANRKVVFVEVSDPSCPFCHIAGGLNSTLNSQSPQFKLVKDGGTYIAPVPEMKKLADSGKASYVWIYFPGHGAGEMGAKALYCANEKGKFWAVNDLLMTSKGYDLLNNTVKNDKAQSQTLADFLAPAFSSKDMKACLDSGKYDARLKDDMALAQTLGVTGTPGFYLNNTYYEGAYGWNVNKIDPQTKQELPNTNMQILANKALGK